MKKEILNFINEKFGFQPEEFDYENSINKDSNCYEVSIIGFKIGNVYQIVICSFLLDAIEPIWNILSLKDVEKVDLKKYIVSYRKANDIKKR